MENIQYVPEKNWNWKKNLISLDCNGLPYKCCLTACNSLREKQLNYKNLFRKCIIYLDNGFILFYFHKYSGLSSVCIKILNCLISYPAYYLLLADKINFSKICYWHLLHISSTS